jgi:tetratricopeptide (TPR) repeat protein
LLLLFAANWVLYRPTIGLGFLNVDDPDYVANNPYIGNFSVENTRHVFTTPYAANYAPFNLLSYTLDVVLGGGRKAEVIHRSNVIWHGMAVAAVYLLAFAIWPRRLAAILAAALFLLHPCHVEVVAWISSRKDLVATTFGVLSTAAYVFFSRGGPRRAWAYAVSVLCFFMGSGAKQSVLLLPVIFLAWDFFVSQRRSWRMLLDKIPFGLTALFFGWMTWRAQPPTGQTPHLFTVAWAELQNLWLLAGFGRYALYRAAPDPRAWSLASRLALYLVAALAWLIPLLAAKSRQPISAALGYWVFINMIPPMVLSFIIPVTDRYLFLPSVGVCLLAGNWLGNWLERGGANRVAAVILSISIAAIFAGQTLRYLSQWNDPRSVWYFAHQHSPNPQVAQFLGEIYQNTGDRMDSFIRGGLVPPLAGEKRLAARLVDDPDRLQRLIAEWEGGAKTKTNSMRYRDEAWAAAASLYTEAVQHRGTLSAPNLFLNRGRLLISQGKYREAIPEFQTALNFAQTSKYEVIRRETSAHALRSIGVAYWNLREYRPALEVYLRAQALQNQAGQSWIPTLDQEVEKLRRLAAASPK